MQVRRSPTRINPRRRFSTRSTDAVKVRAAGEPDQQRSGLLLVSPLGAQARYLDRAVINVLHYDNRADPAAAEPEIRDFAWKTRFDVAALRVETGGEWTLLLQALDGSTVIDPYVRLTWKYDSQSALVAKRWRSHMLALRYDAFKVEFEDDPLAAGSEDGHAWDLAYSYQQGEHWRFALEWLRVDSDVPARWQWMAEPAFATETKIEFSAHYSVGVDFK